jgi:DNA-binding response OmpR family regulator
VEPPNPELAGERVVHAVTAPGARRRVLVVDDEDAIRLLVERALQHHGYDVETAVDGLEALEKAQKERYDLVLLDAMLPRMHGFDVARRIRTDPTLRDQRVIMMTAVYRGWRFAQDTRQSYGTHDYIEKPFRIEDLLRRVDAALASGTAPGTPPPVAAIVDRGRTAFTEGRLDDAAAAFEEAIAADAFSADAHQGLGEVLRLRGDAFRAMTELERAIELKPDLLDAIRILAALYLGKGFRAKAAETLERGIAATSDPRQRDQLRRELLRLL